MPSPDREQQPSRAVLDADLLVVGDVLTIDSADRRIRDGAVAVSTMRGVIVAVGDAGEIRRRCPSGITELGGPGHLVTPGFVDGHQHLTGDRLLRSTIPDDLTAAEAIGGWAIPLHRSLTAADDHVAATLATADALLAGVTTVVDAGTVAHPLAVTDACRSVGIRARLGTWGSDTPGVPGAGGVDAGIARQVELLDALGTDRSARVHAIVTLVGHDLMSDELVTVASALARDRDTTLAFHLSPDRRDGEVYVARTGSRPIVHLARLGVLGSHVLVGHANHIDGDELDALVASRTAVVACPWAYLRLAQGVTVAGARTYGELLARGGRLAIGCDSENAGDRIDVLAAAALLVGLVRDRAEDPRRLTARDALALATRDGAEAVGLGEVTGSLQPGLAADLVVHRASAVADPAIDLVWGRGARAVRHVVVAGQVVVRDAVVVTVDVDAAEAEAAGRARALLSDLGSAARDAAR